VKTLFIYVKITILFLKRNFVFLIMIALLRTKTQLRQWSMRYDVNNFDRPMDQCRDFPVFDTIKQKLEFANQCWNLILNFIWNMVN